MNVSKLLLKFQEVSEKSAKNPRGYFFSAALCMYIHRKYYNTVDFSRMLQLYCIAKFRYMRRHLSVTRVGLYYD